MDIGFGVDRENELRIQIGISASSLEIAAESIANKHFSDPFVRDNFKQDISNFIAANLHFFDSARDDRSRKEAIYNLSEEKNSLLRQSNDLTLGNAKVYVAAKVEEFNDKYGYLIDGIGVLIGTGQIIGGIALTVGSVSLANPIGVVIGVHVILAGLDSATESILRLRGEQRAVGFMKAAYMDSAEFLGFTRKEGLIAYHTIDGITSVYGLAKFVVKPSARRLFHYMPNEYIRKFQTLSKAALTLKLGGAIYKGTTIYNINESEDGQYNY